MFSTLVPNNQTACEQIPLNMLSVTHNRNTLCCCDDILLPSLITYFVKLSEKYFLFYSQQIQRKKDREETVLGGSPVLFLPAPPVLVITALLMKKVASLLLTGSRIPSLVIGVCNRSSLCSIQILVTLFLNESPVTPGIINLPGPYLKFIIYLVPEGDH